MNGLRLKELRRQIHLSQEELGKKLGVVKQTVSSWENEKYDPDYNTFARLAYLLDTSVQYLSGETDDPKPVAIDGMDHLSISDDEKEILVNYRNVTEHDRASLRRLVAYYSALTSEYQDALIGKAAELAIKCKDEQ